MAKRVKRHTRKSRRSSRKASRRSASRRRQSGGWQALTPADLDDSMQGPSQLSSAQGTDYKMIHKGQYGGAYTPMDGAPLGETGVLDDGLRATARVASLDSSFSAIQGMKDQSGGGRKGMYGGAAPSGTPSGQRGGAAPSGTPSGQRGGAAPSGTPSGQRGGKRRGSRRGRRGSRRGRRGSRRGRRHSGGGMHNLSPSDYSAPGHLLSPAAESKALMEMNPEWKLAANPTSFAPK